MCGFAGFYDGNIKEKGAIIDSMSELIAHRGPDSSGTYCDDYVGFGFRRLSIIDLEGGTQPIYSDDGRYLIVFNGEIYNYREIRKELADTHGTLFKTDSDTEIILRTYEIYHEDTAAKLRGMFAFVIYDSLEHTLYGARDYFGIKPFYYTQADDSFIFGSEIKSFLAHPSFKKEVNKDALKLYLMFQYTPTDESIFKGVYKLEPGSYFTYDGKNLKIEKYFTVAYEEKKRTFDEAVSEIDSVVQSSVDYHQISDVEVGSFLSGGVDSSYIASSVKPMKTYSVGFEIEGFDETCLAADLSRILTMENVTQKISPDDFFRVLPSVQYHSDEPHANLSAVPLFFLSDLASKDLKVVLSGEGADEMFGGYDTYFESAVGNVYKALLPQGMRRKLAAWVAGKPRFKGKAFIERNAVSVEESFVGQSFIMGNEEANEILADAYKSDITFQDVTKPYFDKVKDLDDLHKKMYLDMHVWLPNDILLKADRMTMAHSLELRVPYLDKEVWSVARTLESDHCVKGRESKRAFRGAALTKIPTEWAKRKKVGFPVPIRMWLREEKYYSLVKEMFNREFTAEFFDRDILLGWLEEHRSERADHQRKIYTVYSFLLWYEQFFIVRA